MSRDQIIEEFIHASIPSIWTLELLLLLHREPERCWTAPALVRELRASTSLVDDNLGRLQQHGLAIQDQTGWRFHSPNSRLASVVEDLRILYRERPVHVMGLITRSDPVRLLANAFRIKKDET